MALEPGGPRPSLFLDQAEARRAENNFLMTAPPPPPHPIFSFLFFPGLDRKWTRDTGIWFLTLQENSGYRFFRRCQIFFNFFLKSPRPPPSSRVKWSAPYFSIFFSRWTGFSLVSNG